MLKMFSWLANLIPEQYSVGIAIKKMSYTVAKFAVALLSMGKAKTLIGDHLTPDQILQIQGAVGTVVAAGLTAIQDWAKLKWPDAKWI